MSALKLSAFQLSSPHSQSNIQLKSGSITNTVGKSVSLLAISSICLVTQSINQLGNDHILGICIFTISSKLHQSKEEKSKSTDTSQFHQSVNNHLLGSSENEPGKNSNACSIIQSFESSK